MQFKKKANVFATLALVASSLCSSFVGVASAETKSGGQPGYEVTNLSLDFRLQVTGPNGYKAPVYCYDPDFEAPSLGGKPVRYERFDFYDGMKTVANRKGSKEKVDTVMTALLLGYPNNLMGDKLTSVAQSDMNQGLGGFNNTHTLNDYMWSSTQQAVWAIAQPGGGHVKNNYIKDIVAFAKKYPLSEDTAKAKYAMIVDSKNQVISDQNPLVVNPTTHKSQVFMLHKNYQLPVQIKDLPQNLSILDAKGKKTTTLIPGVSYYVQGDKDFSGKIDFKANFFKIKDDNFFAPLDSTGSIAIPYQNVVNTSYEIVPVSIPVTGSKVDQKTTIEISKQDITGKEIAGAKLAILDANGKEVTSWTSGKTSHKVQLLDGKYTLKETQAPEGYEIAESIPFEVKDGKVVGKNENKIVMIDKQKISGGTQDKPNVPTPTKAEVEISKQDVAGKEIAGAKLAILDANGKEVTSWTSDNTSHKVELSDGKYTLKETQAPEGYEIAENIPFEVKDGKVVGSATNKIVMIDKQKISGGTQDKPNIPTPTPQKQKVILSKQDVAGKEIAGAQLTLTTNGQEVDSWISEEGKDHEFLATPNQEYTLQEVQAPKGYKLAESITFRVNEEGKVEIKNGTTWTSLADNKVVMVDTKKTSEKPNVPIKPTPSTSKKAKVEVAKIDVLGKEVVGAKLEIDANGKTVDAWISDTTSHKVKLSDGKYTLKEIEAPKGYEVAESISFEVKDGKVVGQTTNTIVMVDKEAKEERHKKPEVIKETVMVEKTTDDYHPSSGASSQSSKEDDQSDLPQTGTHQSSIELVIGFGLLIISLFGFQWLRKRYN